MRLLTHALTIDSVVLLPDGLLDVLEAASEFVDRQLKHLFVLALGKLVVLLTRRLQGSFVLFSRGFVNDERPVVSIDFDVLLRSPMAFVCAFSLPFELIVRLFLVVEGIHVIGSIELFVNLVLHRRLDVGLLLVALVLLCCHARISIMARALGKLSNRLGVIALSIELHKRR